MWATGPTVQFSFFQTVDWLSMVLCLRLHNIGYMADGFFQTSFGHYTSTTLKLLFSKWCSISIIFYFNQELLPLLDCRDELATHFFHRINKLSSSPYPSHKKKILKCKSWEELHFLIYHLYKNSFFFMHYISMFKRSITVCALHFTYFLILVWLPVIAQFDCIFGFVFL